MLEHWLSFFILISCSLCYELWSHKNRNDDDNNDEDELEVAKVLHLLPVCSIPGCSSNPLCISHEYSKQAYERDHVTSLCRWGGWYLKRLNKLHTVMTFTIWGFSYEMFGNIFRLFFLITFLLVAYSSIGEGTEWRRGWKSCCKVSGWGKSCINMCVKSCLCDVAWNHLLHSFVETIFEELSLLHWSPHHGFHECQGSHPQRWAVSFNWMNEWVNEVTLFYYLIRICLKLGILWGQRTSPWKYLQRTGDTAGLSSG